jgi:2-dehydro-3-deoxygluconokinase
VALVCREALEKANAMGMTISADFNYRSKLWQYGKHPRDIMPDLLSHADILVADPDAAHIYLGLSHGTAESHLPEKFGRLSEGMGARLPKMKTLAMSVRSQSSQGLPTYQAALQYKGEHYFSKIHEIPFTEDRIGSGDAFTGGLIYALGHRQNPQEIIDFAAACAVLKHSIQGDFALVSLEEILDFLRLGPTTRIIR